MSRAGAGGFPWERGLPSVDPEWRLRGPAGHHPRQPVHRGALPQSEAENSQEGPGRRGPGGVLLQQRLQLRPQHSRPQPPGGNILTLKIFQQWKYFSTWTDPWTPWRSTWSSRRRRTSSGCGSWSRTGPGRSSAGRVETSHWSRHPRYCALIGWDLNPALLCHKETAQGSKSPLTNLSLCLHGIKMASMHEKDLWSSPLCRQVRTGCDWGRGGGGDLLLHLQHDGQQQLPALPWHRHRLPWLLSLQVRIF